MKAPIRKSVEERKARRKAQAQQHKTTADRPAEAIERFEQVVNNIPEVFWLFDVAKSRVIYVSPGYESVWGRKCEELYREPSSWLASVHPEDRNTIQRRFLTEQAGDGYDVRYRILRPDGSVRWIRDRAFPVRNARGEVRRIAGLAEDVTERKQTEEQLQTQAAILDNMAEGVVVTDEEGRIVQMNPAAERMWGYEQDEVLGRSAQVLSALPEPDATELMQEVLTTVLAGGFWRGIFKNRRKDGKITLSEAVVGHLEIHGRTFTVAVEQDVTERKRTELTKEVFLSLGMKLSAARSALDAARAIYAAADLLWNWDSGLLDLWLPESDQIKTVLAWDVLDGQRREVTLHSPVRQPRAAMRRIMRKGAELILRQQGDTPGTDFVPFGDVSRRSASIMCVPVRKENRAVGTLSVQSYTPNAFTQEDLRTLQSLADHCGGALDRIQAAEARRESEERYHSLVNNLNVGVYRNQPGIHEGFVHANPALARMHGYDSVEEFMKARVVEHYQDPHERERFLADLQRQGTLSNYELRLKRADGTPIYASVNATAHRGPSGDVDWIDGVVEDITERKRAQEALRSSEERYRTLAESSPEAIFILDRDIKVRYVNSTAAALWGRPPKDLIGLPQTELFPPEAAQYHSTIVTNVFETGNVVHREERLTCPVGDQWIEIRLAPLYDAQGTVTSVMCVCRDITERKRAEQQLAETLDLNQKMIAASSLGIAAYKASGECVFTNEALARTIGARLNEVLQANFRRVEVWRESGLLELSDEALRQGQARSGEIFCTTRFGKTVWLDCHLAPFVSNGQPHLLLMVLDISERKRAEFLLRAQRDLGVSLSLTSDMTVALNRLLEIAVQLGGLDCGGVYLLNQANQEIDLAVYRGVSTSFAKAVAHYSADGPEMKQLWRGPFFFTARQKLTIPLVSARLREGLRGIALLPLSHNRNIIGALALASHTSEEIPVQTRIVIEAIAAQAAGAIARIRAEAERHRLERQILDISDREQARIGQDIHDGLCQHLVSLAFDANSLRAELAVKHRPEAKKARRIADYLDEAITEARQLSRGLFPVRLEGEGLPPALEELARVTRDRFKIRCRFVCRGPVAVENSVMATHLYRIAQEAVSNAVKHSRARSVAIRLRARAGALELSIEDDGAGLSPARGKKAAGLGLHIMDYRTRTIGGTLQVGPGRRGGTVVSCCVPRPRE